MYILYRWRQRHDYLFTQHNNLRLDIYLQLLTHSLQSGTLSSGCLQILRPMRHLRNPKPSGFDGLVVRLLDSIDPHATTLDLIVSVRVVQYRPLCRQSNTDLATYLVPLRMLVSPHMWPIGYSQSVYSRKLLYGLPYSDRALGLQVGERYTLASSARPETMTVRENMPYCAGDYFTVPLLMTAGNLESILVAFMCVVQDTDTKTCW